MAKKNKGLGNTASVSTRTFNKGMVKDLNKSLISEGAYLHARNAINNSKTGDMGVIENEPSNLLCARIPYTVIGSIHLYEDKWAIFSTDDVNSEIGLFEEDLCKYTTVVNDSCLNFKKSNLITGVARENFECEWIIYWADNLNPDRRMSIDNPPYIQIPDPNNTDPNCNVTIDSPNLDCDKIRIARTVKQPCIKIKPAGYGGELLNGSYQVAIAYLENGLRVTDYSNLSNIVSLFDHSNVNGNIEIHIDNLDENYDTYELVVLSFINNKLVAKRIGEYSTNQSDISIDRIDPSLISVPLEFLLLDIPAYEKSEAIFKNGPYLLRVAPTTKFDFNYQILANQIEAEYVVVKYPANYYRNAGVNVGYMRDEVYSFFIRWVYDTGDKTSSFHIPGRPPQGNDLTTVPSNVYGGTEYLFESTNTAGTPLPDSGTTSDGGIIFKKGRMAYWQSTEKYPDDKPEVWGNLCGDYIRHHKFPDNSIINHFEQGGQYINVLGIRFKNIPFPVDNQNNPIKGIVGYEILRGSREGNKTVLAKGLINNMGTYRNYDNNGNFETIYYQNYPYNDLRKDPFLSVSKLKNDKDNDVLGGNVQSYGGSWYKRNSFSFHSPDTQFKHPFLSAKELKIYNNHFGDTEGVFVSPYKHPRFKIINNAAFFISILVGLGLAFKKLKGEEKTIITSGNTTDTVFIPAPTGSTNAVGAGAAAAGVGTINGNIAAISASYGAGIESLLALGGFSGIAKPGNATAATSILVSNLIPGLNSSVIYEFDPVGFGLPGFLKQANSTASFLAFWGQNTDDFIELIKNFSAYRHHVTAYQSHAFYNHYSSEQVQGFKIENASYIKDRLHSFDNITINNLFRNGFIALKTTQQLPDPVITDDSRFTMGQSIGVDESNLNKHFKKGKASSHYVALKQKLRNQYGQLEGIIQVPTASCFKAWETDLSNPPNATSDIIFGGDTYIGRYTEKNTFFYFFDWLYDMPDGLEYDYLLRKMIPFPTYWMNTDDYQINDFFNGVFSGLCDDSDSPSGDIDSSGILPNSFHNFETSYNTNIDDNTNNWLCNGGISLIVKDAFMYLFNSGVRDFFVESEVNVEYRDWGDKEEERHYDPYLHTAYSELFRTDRIKILNYYKYDYSLSISRYYQAYSSVSSLHARDYDPNKAETCYTHYAKRILYSLPQQLEAKKDYWSIFLVDNYKDFTSRITTVKPVAKNGAFILFETEAPVQFLGVDTLETDLGTKITLGDGGLFKQALQNVVNTDSSYEYGSCQNRLSVINTPAGLFWISQNQGKIFQYANTLIEISAKGMKWWFEEFLPYKLLEDFPNFELTDNTVIGIGTHSIYDNNNSLLYFSKKDYKVKPEYKGLINYISNDDFEINGLPIKLGDLRYFDSASWTVSYDPKTQSWISFHDWHPSFMLPSKNSFMTILNDSIWTHNNRCDSYCNFYGVDYPFEVEVVNPTGQNVNTLKSIEYLMEVYEWADNCVDKHHVLDFNFDRAVVYNSEQVSGELRLNLKPKNDPIATLSYPRTNFNNIDILYSKEEQKYRFNQFWDITDNRGEFSNARRDIWVTEANGYIKSLNPLNLNYQKNNLERKRFRHYEASLLLKRRVSGAHNMQLKLINNKNQYSIR
jgi:hypothetical protein